MDLTSQVNRMLAESRRRLLAARNEEGHWTGSLSSSALSTATAIVALHLVDPERYREKIRQGAEWLLKHQNADGGWGDTTLSFSNISTTLLCWSALGLVGKQLGVECDGAVDRAANWIADYVGGVEPEALARAVTARYGKDRTFAVPILMMCAICGRLGPRGRAWRRVLPLPFELAALPQGWFAALRLPVVSYALPALIAIGQARFHHAPPPAPWRQVRGSARGKTLALLERIQPDGGGYLEATPLTSFVTMALASADMRDHAVVHRACEFLERSMRADGSWPIDTNLATWCSTLAVKALASERDGADFGPADKAKVRDWLINQQYTGTHPYTNAAPGGWAWTDLDGGVPDADDTPGALLALHALGQSPGKEIEAGMEWLLGLQNRDGGIPTFCHGWGTMPFDRSSPDITAHTLRAFARWRTTLSPALRRRVEKASERALKFLRRRQRPAGAWHPLWFGNQNSAEETNAVYGTSMVLLALECMEDERIRAMWSRGADWLRGRQNEDGGWGGDAGCPSSIEETALALHALARKGDEGALARGVDNLDRATTGGTKFPPAPIGFYFAKLWYYEELYPLVWTVSALEAVKARLSRPGSGAGSASS